MHGCLLVGQIFCPLAGSATSDIEATLKVVMESVENIIIHLDLHFWPLHKCLSKFTRFPFSAAKCSVMLTASR